MKRKSVIYLTVALSVVLAIFIACAVNPVTGERELNLLSESQEIQLGKQADPAIVAQYGLYDDPKLAEFVEKMGQKMAKISHRPDLPFTFRVLDSPVVNAFALPGGFVYFTRGILAYMNSEAELAGVLGHEIGHVTARHGAKAYTRAQLAQVGFAAGYIFSETFRQFSDVAEMGVGLLFLSFSRDQERQSDKLGVEYSTAIGYDAQRMSRFFGTLDRLQEQSGQTLPGWFSTHPNPEEREQKTLEMAQKAQQESSLSNFDVDRNAYLNLIDGIVFGEDPRQGFVEDGYFYHPTLDFQFPVPSGWKLQNSPTVVQMVNEEQNAGMEFSLSQEGTARAAAEKFIANSKATVISSDYTKVHGYTTEIRESTVATQQGELKVLSYFIEKENNVYIFHGYANTANYAANTSAFKYTMNGFDRLRNEAARSVQPTRIKVVKVNKTTTLKAFLAKYPTDKASDETLAIINGMELSDTLMPGDRVKVLSQ